MVRLGSVDGKTNAKCTSRVTAGSLIIGTIPEGYRPNGFLNSCPFTFGPSSSECNVSVTAEGGVSFYCQGTIEPNAEQKRTIQLSYFVI